MGSAESGNISFLPYYHPWHSDSVKVKLILSGTTVTVVRTRVASRVILATMCATLPYGRKAYSLTINLYISMLNLEIFKRRPHPAILQTTSCVQFCVHNGEASTPSSNATAFHPHLLQLKMFLSWPLCQFVDEQF